MISAKEKIGFEQLKREILQKFKGEYVFCTLSVPYLKNAEYCKIKYLLTERTTKYLDDGVKIEVVIPSRYIKSFQEFIIDYKK
jgi:50S ribosomal subunit-associated GTPase HflX